MCDAPSGSSSSPRSPGTVLVTGAGGFVGRRLVCRLRADGYPVRAVLRRPCAPGTFSEAVDVRVTGDLEDFTGWGTLLDGVDAVVHLAGRVHVMGERGADAADLYRRANVEATRRLGRAAAAAGARRLVFMSTAKVLGEESPLPYRDDDPPRPRGAYARSKREAEEVLGSIGKETGLETVTLRPPLVYGPGVRANFLRLMRWVDRGLPLPLGAVRNARSMIFLDNLVDAVLAVLHASGVAGCCFLVADEEALSSPDLVKRLAVSLERPARLLPVPPGMLAMAGKLTGRGEEVQRLTGSLMFHCDGLRCVSGWRPPDSSSKGIATTCAWYRQTVGLPTA